MNLYKIYYRDDVGSHFYQIVEAFSNGHAILTALDIFQQKFPGSFIKTMAVCPL